MAKGCNNHLQYRRRVDGDTDNSGKASDAKRKSVNRREKKTDPWKNSENVVKSIKKRQKDTHVDHILKLTHPDLRPKKEDDLHRELVELMEPTRAYQKPLKDAKVDKIKSELSNTELDQLRKEFRANFEKLKPTGNSSVWELQEQGRVPVFGAFLFYMRLIGLDLKTGDTLQKGMLKKKTREGEEIDPVQPFVRVDNKNKKKYRFLVVHRAGVCDIGQVNGRLHAGKDGMEYVRERAAEYAPLERPEFDVPFSIFDGTWEKAYDLAFLDKEDFKEKRRVAGPARTLEQLEEFYYGKTWTWANKPASMPTCTVSECWALALGSKIVRRPVEGCDDNERICSFATYVNVIEEVIEAARTGEERKLCPYFAKLLRHAQKCGEAVIGLKPGNGAYSDLVIVTPFGMEYTIAMRPPSRPSNRHDTKNSGESTGSEYVFRTYKDYERFYRIFNEGGQIGIPVSEFEYASFVPCHHEFFARTKRIKVPDDMREREIPILSPLDECPKNYALVNSKMRTVSSRFGSGKETRAQCEAAYLTAFRSLREEFISLDLTKLPKMDIPTGEELLSSLDVLIASLVTPAADRRVSARI